MKLDVVRVGLLVFAVTSFGCAKEEDEFQYDREDMEAAVFGTWTGTYTAMDATAVPLTLEIRSHDDVARDLACTGRSFSDRSGTPGLELSCSPGSTLAVSATLVVDSAESPRDFDGYFTVHGLTLSGGSLSLVDRNSDVSIFTASLNGRTWDTCRYGEGPNVLGSCTLDARVEE